MTKQVIEGREMQINADFKGAEGKMSIFADKIEYDSGALRFFYLDKEILRIPLRRDYSTIYEALERLGISVIGY